MNNVLLATILIPMIGALVVAMLGTRGKATVRMVALATAGITLTLAAHLVVQYWQEKGLKGDYAVDEFFWLGQSTKIHFAFGLDGLSIWMYGLSALLTFTAVLVSWDAVHDRPAGFYALLLLLASGMIGVFAARDIIMFYMFFEFTLIPLYFLIGIWGHEERRYAANKFFLFTFTGSVLALLGLLGIVLWVYKASGILTWSIPELHAALAPGPGGHPIPTHLQFWIFLALLCGFAVKVPLVPLHTWLPLAHTQAPTGGSIDLAGILLKLGTYGILRFCLPMLPDATAMCMPWIMWLAVIGIVYGALVSLVQTDLKKLIAYSSVSHMGFVILGFFALNAISLQGGILQMINHGLSSAGLFAVVGMVYERYHTRQISELGGLAKRTPMLATYMVIFTMASIGLPGLNGFVGEFFILLGTFQRAWAEAPGPLGPQLLVVAVLAVSGVVLGAWYMLWMLQRVFFGPLKEGHLPPDKVEHIRDLSWHESLALAPLVVFIVWIGLFPQLFLQAIAPAADEVIARTKQPLQDYYAAKPNDNVKAADNEQKTAAQNQSAAQPASIKTAAAN